MEISWRNIQICAVLTAQAIPMRPASQEPLLVAPPSKTQVLPFGVT